MSDDMLKLSAELGENLARHRAAYGDLWPEVSKPAAAEIRRLMAEWKTENPLKVALSIADRLIKNEVDPSFVLAVATDQKQFKQ